MTLYAVTLSIHGGCTKWVEADDEDAAIEQAMEDIEMGDWNGDVTPEYAEVVE